MLLRSQGSVCLLVACLAAGIACYSRHASGEVPQTQSTQHTEWEARIEAALDAKGVWEFEDVPFNEVCVAIREKLGIDVAIDSKSLEDSGIDARAPVTLSISGISNRSCLRLMLNDLELTYTMHLGALWITTHEAAWSRLTTKVYPVGDLLIRDPSRGHGTPDYE